MKKKMTGGEIQKSRADIVSRVEPPKRKKKGGKKTRWIDGLRWSNRRGDGEKVKGMRKRRSANYRSALSLSFLDNLRAAGETGIGGDCGRWMRYIAMDFSRHFSRTSIKRALMGQRARVRDIRGRGGESARSYTAANPLCSVSRGAKGKKK